MPGKLLLTELDYPIFKNKYQQEIVHYYLGNICLGNYYNIQFKKDWKKIDTQQKYKIIITYMSFRVNTGHENSL